jgi:hypothetical protein
MKELKYIGILPESDSRQYAGREFSHSKIVRGREVRYFHTWAISSDHVDPIFREEEQPNQSKIRALESWLGINFKTKKP